VGSGDAETSDVVTIRRKVMANQVVWVDVPVMDLDRAIAFYSAVLGRPVRKQEYPGMAIGLLPGEDPDVTGCLVPEEDGLKISDSGPRLYLNADGRLDEAVAAVEPNGGQVLQPRHPIGPYGHRAIIRDSEGNRVALHSS
jgi:predicted enzyme related to lactoylglutathione lyase